MGNCAPPPQTSANGKQSGSAATEAPLNHQRALRVESTSGSAGSTVTVNIRVDAIGDESVYDFDLTYDSMVLSNPVVGAGNTGATILDCQTGTSGQVNCIIEGFPTNNPSSSNSGIREIPAGDDQILITVTFTIAANATPGSTTPLTIPDGSNASNDAGVLFQLIEQNGTVTILRPTAATTSISGRVKDVSGAGIGGVSVTLLNASSGETQTTLTNAEGVYRFEDLAVGVDYIITPRLARHSFTPSSKSVSLVEELTETDFTAYSKKTRRRL